MKIFEIYEGKLKITRENFDEGNQTTKSSIDTEKSPAFTGALRNRVRDNENKQEYRAERTFFLLDFDLFDVRTFSARVA